MSLSQKEKVRLQAKRIKRLRYKATGLYLYHPASDSWIPAQADEEGRLVIDPSDLDARYHKKGEDLDLDIYKLLTKNFLVKESGSQLQVRNRADDDFRDWAVRALYLKEYHPIGASHYFRTYQSAAGITYLQSYNGAAWVTVASIGGADDLLDIPRAGDIVGLAGKLIDMPNYRVSGIAGVDGNFTSADPKTVIVQKGLITNIVAR